ncbi:conserved exported hypothetical protein [Novosphingobium sp. 9U]|nr:conserved exported hypothetical protein [Novosphingobium sp. 9U]
MRIMLAILLATSATMATSAEACREDRSPAQKLSNGYQGGTISAVAVITISHAAYTHEPVSDAHPWMASGTVDRVVYGSYIAVTVRFVRGWGSSACDDGLPPPKVGERWVPYLTTGADDRQRVWLAYPAEVARAADLTHLRDVR